ncbi:hypothetical protein TNIN_353481 [Trichonephila inaurata madagascariensis]|uniref:Uncharacterized protein n=1 Tax=Trichonephila inaurata madagascariensis TaxID=2747483 RepID=A0A8X6X8S5_9ARAC|nr:hypothetical protein TNIN_353481 [Trichonephila inaurata madagascariensis]
MNKRIYHYKALLPFIVLALHNKERNKRGTTVRNEYQTHPKWEGGEAYQELKSRKEGQHWAEDKRGPTRNQGKPQMRKMEGKREKIRVNPKEKCISTGFVQMMISNGTYKHHRPPENHKYNL